MSKEFINSRQITIFQTGKNLLEFRDHLSPAEACNASNIHANFSKIRVVALDYSNGKGDKTISTDINIDPDVFKYIVEEVLHGRLTTFEEHKNIVSRKNDAGECKVTKFSIKYVPKDNTGNVMRYCWYVSLENGLGMPIQGKNGSVTLKEGSYRKEASVLIRVDDMNFKRMFIQVRDYINAFEINTMSWLLGERKLFEEQRNVQ